MYAAQETYRATLPARTLDGQLHTLIVTRRGLGTRARTWLTLHGAWKTTVELTDPEAIQLADLLTHPQREGAGPDTVDSSR